MIDTAAIAQIIATSLPAPMAKILAEEICRRVETMSRVIHSRYFDFTDGPRIFKTIGKQGLLTLIFLRGGSRVFVPNMRRAGSEHWLVRSIGIANARALSQEFGGSWIKIPTLSKFMTFFRPELADKMRRDGLTTKDIAKAIGVSDRQVFRLTEKY